MGLSPATDDELHERPAVARLAVPGIPQHVATAQRPGKVHGVCLQQAVTDAVDTLEPEPGALPDFGIPVAERHDTRAVGAGMGEDRLDHTVVAARLKQLGALEIGGAHILARRPGIDADDVTVVVTELADLI